MKWSRYNILFRSEKHGPMLYNSRTNAFAVIEEELYEKRNCLKKGECFIKDEFSDKEFKKLCEAEVFVPEKQDELAELKMETCLKRLSTKSMSLTIAPTLDCNFKCPYCFEKRPEIYMDEQTCKNMVSFVKSRNPEALYITWYGGEPLLAFETIKKLSYEFTRQFEHYRARMITNGYLLAHNVISKLNDLRIETIQITIDGPEHIHNSRRMHRKRNDSYEVITGNILNLLSTDWKGKLVIRMNVDRDNRDYFAQTYSELLAKFNNDQRVFISAGIVHSMTSVCASIEGSCMSNSDTVDFELSMYREHGIRSMNLYPGLNPYLCPANGLNTFVAGPEENCTNAGMMWVSRKGLQATLTPGKQIIPW